MTRAAIALGAGSIGAVGAAAWPFTVDDAWVTARYARRLLRGDGYTFVDGPPTDGVTGPVGLVPGLAGELGLGDPMLGMKIAGLLATAVAVAWVIARAGRESPRHALVTAILVSGWPLLGIWSVAGLETGLATLGCTAVAIGLVERRTALLGVAIAALAWLRPEAAPACLVALALHTRDRGRPSAAAWGLALGGALALVAFRVGLFGAPLPLSVSAKPADLGHGIEYTARAALVVLGIFGVVPVYLAARTPGPHRGLLAVLVAHVAAVVLAGGDWMPGFRLFVPWLPALAWVVAGPIATRWTGETRSRLAAAALLAGSVVIPAVAGGLALLDARAAGEARDTAGAELAGWLREHSERVALVDVGYLGFASDRDLVDLGGITDPEIARLPGVHVAKEIDPGLLLARDPDTIVLHSRMPPVVDEEGRLRRFAGHPVEGRVAAMPWVRAQMRVTRVEPYAPGVWYVVLSR